MIKLILFLLMLFLRRFWVFFVKSTSIKIPVSGTSRIFGQWFYSHVVSIKTLDKINKFSINALYIINAISRFTKTYVNYFLIIIITKLQHEDQTEVQSICHHKMDQYCDPVLPYKYDFHASCKYCCLSLYKNNIYHQFSSSARVPTHNLIHTLNTMKFYEKIMSVTDT